MAGPLSRLLEVQRVALDAPAPIWPWSGEIDPPPATRRTVAEVLTALAERYLTGCPATQTRLAAAEGYTEGLLQVRFRYEGRWRVRWLWLEEAQRLAAIVFCPHGRFTTFGNAVDESEWPDAFCERCAPAG